MAPRGAEDKITIDFTGRSQNASMLALFLLCVADKLSSRPGAASHGEVARPASHASPTPSWESTQRKIIIDPTVLSF